MNIYTYMYLQESMFRELCLCDPWHRLRKATQPLMFVEAADETRCPRDQCSEAQPEQKKL